MTKHLIGQANGVPIIGKKSIVDISADGRTITINLSEKNSMPMQQIGMAPHALLPATMLAMLQMCIIADLADEARRGEQGLQG